MTISDSGSSIIYHTLVISLTGCCGCVVRTDFYVTMKTPVDKMGFPPGISEKLTMSVCLIFVHILNVTFKLMLDAEFSNS